MNILAIETTGKYGSAAIIDEYGIAYSSDSDNELNHLRDIISLIDECLNLAELDKSELRYIAASIGPGSFTGIRIGVTTARTLAQMLDIPCVAVSSLEAMAINVLADAKAKSCDLVVPIINARRHQTYAGAWATTELGGSGSSQSGADDIELENKFEEKQYIIEDLLTLIRENDCKPYFVGDGIDAYDEIIKEQLKGMEFYYAPTSIRYQTAVTVAQLGASKAEAGEAVAYADLLPNYMRLSEAEQRLKEGSLSAKIRKQD